MPLLSVYNNLIHGYLMTRQTKFDAHNRRELAEIHQKLRRMSVEQPLYKINFDDEAQEYTLSVKDQALDLSVAVKELAEEGNDSVFSQKVIVSENPETVGVEVLPGADTEEFEQIEVAVRSLAQTQINEGRLVEAKATSLMGGQYNFTVEVEGNLYSFQFNVSEESTNKELQIKLSDFINKTKVGLKSRVVTEGKESRLEISAVEEGKTFEFKDTKIPDGEFYGIVTQFGMNSVTKEAAKTLAVVNGEEIESTEREYVTSGGIKLSFANVTDEDKPVSVAKVTDDTVVFDKIKTFVDKYNNFSSYVREGGNTRRASKKLYYEINNFMARHRQELDAIGLHLENDGIVSINKSEVTEAIRNGTMENMFEKNSDLSSGLVRKLRDISLNPIDYIDKTIVVYNNTRARKPYNPYVTSIYSGIMYNNYC